jgi:hypothetical protein
MKALNKMTNKVKLRDILRDRIIRYGYKSRILKMASFIESIFQDFLNHVTGLLYDSACHPLTFSPKAIMNMDSS